MAEQLQSNRDASPRPGAGGLELLVGPEQYHVDLARVPAAWTFTVAIVVLVAVALVRSPPAGFHPGVVATIAGVGVVLPPAMFLWGRKWPVGLLLGVDLAGVAALVVGVGAAGPHFGETTVLLATAVSTTWIWFSRRWAVAFLCVVAIGYGVVVTTVSGYSDPLARWAFVIGVTAALNGILAWLILRIRRLAEEERAATTEVRRLAVAEGEARREAEAAGAQLQVANSELAAWGRTLEQRVAAQVAEIEALNRLRRFLSPQVADAVLRSVASGDDTILEPHRRQIAVVFIDLRGFTAFAGSTEPEEVVGVLDSYYRVVGDELRRCDATVGSFAGDGIMAYFGDPVPCDDPAGTAVRMALALRAPMETLMRSWRERGFRLGYGVGIAYGYATLGTIGFEERADYTALGSVVNLASRLCGEAASGEVLIDAGTHAALAPAVQREPRDLMLKGFSDPVRAFAVQV